MLDKDLYRRLSKTYYTAQHLWDTAVHVIPIQAIQSVVAHSQQDGTANDRWFLMEKPGLKVDFDLLGMTPGKVGDVDENRNDVTEDTGES